MNYFRNKLSLFIIAMMHSSFAFAADSYRFFHVTIETPWLIFIFLLVIILFPFILSAILYWYFTFKKHKEHKALEINSVEPEQAESTAVNQGDAAVETQRPVKE